MKISPINRCIKRASLVLIYWIWEKNTSKAFEKPKLIRIQLMRNQFGQKITSKPSNCKFHTMTTHIHLCFEIQEKKFKIRSTQYVIESIARHRSQSRGYWRWKKHHFRIQSMNWSIFALEWKWAQNMFISMITTPGSITVQHVAMS